MFLINLVFVDQKTIRELNKKYRHLDKPATVLTFFYGEGQADAPVGEIVICPEVGKKKNLSVEKLIIHGYRNLLSEIPAANPLRT